PATPPPTPRRVRVPGSGIGMATVARAGPADSTTPHRITAVSTTFCRIWPSSAARARHHCPVKFTQEGCHGVNGPSVRIHWGAVSTIMKTLFRVHSSPRGDSPQYRAHADASEGEPAVLRPNLARRQVVDLKYSRLTL